jgi:hypothetical protein
MQFLEPLEYPEWEIDLHSGRIQYAHVIRFFQVDPPKIANHKSPAFASAGKPEFRLAGRSLGEGRN